MSDLGDPPVFDVDEAQVEGFIRGMLDEPRPGPRNLARDDAATDGRAEHLARVESTLTPKLGADCTDWSGGTASSQTASALQFDSGKQRFENAREKLRNARGASATRDRTAPDSRAMNHPVAATGRPDDDSPAPMAAGSEWSTMPPGMCGGRVGVRFGGMRAVNIDDASDPLQGWKVVDTPRFGRLSRARSDLHFSRRNRMVARFMRAAALSMPQNTVVVGGLDDVILHGNPHPCAPPRQSIAALVGELARLSETARSSGSVADDFADSHLDALTPVLRLPVVRITPG